MLHIAKKYKIKKIMAVEKGKVLTAIEAKLKGKSLSKNFKDNLATKWAEKIDTDEDIDGYVDDREDVLLEASSEADRRAVAAAKKAKEEAEKPKPKAPETEEEEDALPSDTPEWAKALVKQNKALSSKIEAFESAQKSQTIAERFRKDERITSLKGLPDTAFKGRIPQSEDEFDTAIEEFVNDWKPFVEKHKLSDQADDVPPSGTVGETGKRDVKKLSTDVAKQIVSSMGSYN